MHTTQIKALSVSAGILPAPRRPRALAYHARSAFTLVELLVVIGIIGMITAIAVPTIFGAIASARNAKTKAEVDMLHMAMMNYKNEYGSFPPANMQGLWRTDVTPNQVNKSHAVYKHLVRIFPRLNEVAADVSSPYYAISQLSPAQALVFWLYGFYDNPEYPLTNGGTPGNRRKLFDFDESRLYAASTYLFNGTPQSFAARGSSAASGFSPYPAYFTGHPSCGLPYVYFDSRCYDDAPASDINYAATNTSGDTSIASSYINSLPPANGTWAQQHMAGDTFQLIAAGKDGLYGGSSINKAAYPATVAYSLTWLGTASTYASVKDSINGKGHADNLTNFADRPLAVAIEASQSR
jgi:prepilin-type N-terminal cleavage/methylation domain-containing protein